ncbi:unnamed protein product [Cercopithifilaria johnstoni]|uniref:Uncharacterized protein n=1 Tax=Cercopithifilaria johnstoni TaxID=2874296 RepID=A0A8J2MKW8_9BILA|nr:unnamed protein product [Cercopithifilaria johnstoni]
MEVPLVPWNDFLIECASVDSETGTSGLFESEWKWLKQLCELAGEDCCSEVNNSFQQVTLTLRLDASSYFLKLRWTESFSIVGPEVVTNLGSAFQYSWQNGDTLCSLYHRFVHCCLRIDQAVGLCSDVKYPFTFIGWTVDEDDPTCIAVTLLCEQWHTRKSFQLFLVIDWSEPNIFPRRLTSSPEFLQGLQLDEWDSSNVFADNLTRVFRNMIS